MLSLVQTWNGHQLSDVVDLLERMFGSDKIVADEAWARGLVGILAVHDRIAFVERDFAGVTLDPIKDEVFGFSKMKEKRLLDRTHMLAKGVCEHWGNPNDFLNAMVNVDVANEFFCERFHCTNLTHLVLNAFLAKVSGGSIAS